MDTCRGWSLFRKAAPLKIQINQDADFEGLTNRSTRGKFRLPFLRFFYETHVILGGLRDKNFKFRCIYVPIRFDILPITQQETLTRKPRSVKQKTLDSVEKDRPASIKVLKLEASSSSPSTQVRKPELAQSPPVEAPTVLSSQPRSGFAAKAKGPLGGAIEQPLVVILITVWNPPTKSVRSPSRRAEELRRKDPESEIGGDRDSLLLNAELAASAVSSILKDSDLKRSSALPVDEALALSLQGVASVSSHTLSYLIPF